MSSACDPTLGHLPAGDVPSYRRGWIIHCLVSALAEWIRRAACVSQDSWPGAGAEASKLSGWAAGSLTIVLYVSLAVSSHVMVEQSGSIGGH